MGQFDSFKEIRLYLLRRAVAAEAFLESLGKLSKHGCKFLRKMQGIVFLTPAIMVLQKFP